MGNFAGEDNNLNLEILYLRDRISQLETELEICRKHRKDKNIKPRYTLRERCLILWYIEYFQVSTHKITNRIGVARSTIFRWMNKIDVLSSEKSSPANKTPLKVVQLFWEIAKANPHWGRIRISLQMNFLKIFIAASTVRNILNRPEPSPFKGKNTSNSQEPHKPRSITARYPNHVWSVDRTIVKRWGLWPCYVLVGIDHFSRKVVCCLPLEGPNAGWTISALEYSIERYGAPKHIISDQEPIFTGDAFAEFVKNYEIKPRLGAVGKHGSIAVTERVIKTLKYEWLKRVAIIKGYDHIEKLCNSFVEWYNEWRPHYRLDGNTPDDVFAKRQTETLDQNAKTIPFPIEKRHFQETKTTAFRIQQAA